MVLDFCSQVTDGTTPTTRETNKDGNFDILNFLWFAGPSGIYDNSTGKLAVVYITHIICFISHSRPELPLHCISSFKSEILPLMRRWILSI